MKELYEQFETEAIDANYSISFAKAEGKYFYSQTQAMFNGWILRHKLQNTSSNSDYAKLPSFKDVLDKIDNQYGKVGYEFAREVYNAIKELGDFV